MSVLDELLGRAPGGTRSSDAMTRELPGWVSGALILGTVAVVLWSELRHPLRKQRESKLTRDSRNLAMTALSATAIRITEKPVTDRLSRLVHEKRWGIVKWLRLPPWLEVIVSVLLLDYTLYVWHVLTHETPFLWRFHRVHHADLDLDASTALRFHFTEMMMSVPWRAGQVLLVGAAPRSLATWQTLTLAAILFHHSNAELPYSVERWLCRLLMTPRMHGIHHSIVREETNSNWSTIFSWPDYLHGTHRLNVPQEAIEIGVPELRRPEDVELPKLLALPFENEPPPTWRLPDGTEPQPVYPNGARKRLLP